MPKFGEKFSFELTWRQELGIESVCESLTDWFRQELEELVKAVRLGNVSEDHHIELIMSVVERLEKDRLKIFDHDKKMVELRGKVADLAKSLGLTPGTNW